MINRINMINQKYFHRSSTANTNLGGTSGRGPADGRVSRPRLSPDLRRDLVRSGKSVYKSYEIRILSMYNY